MQSFQWDAKEYARSSGAQQTWAHELIAKLNLHGNERIADIGCGDGKVTAELASHVPHGYVVGIDNSPEMISLAQHQYPSEAFPNLSFTLGDARRLRYYNEFDVVFSNATLHWINDHLPVLRGMYGCLRHGGTALLQMGGRGNAAAVMESMQSLIKADAWRQFFHDFHFQYGFYGSEDYQEWLTQTGLQAVRVEIIPKDMTYPDAAGFAAWIRTTWLPYTERIPRGDREKFISHVVQNYLERHPADMSGTIHVGMVRLEVEARKR